MHYIRPDIDIHNGPCKVNLPSPSALNKKPTSGGLFLHCVPSREDQPVIGASVTVPAAVPLSVS